mmetsp:Transcript_6287/g.7630  ORF Transcript_6287/g.7630 Transcript_6287/m.7630 type:complete len:84 (+) Transcript_6287:213-464(+)
MNIKRNQSRDIDNLAQYGNLQNFESEIKLNNDKELFNQVFAMQSTISKLSTRTKAVVAENSSLAEENAVLKEYINNLMRKVQK